MFGYGSLVSPVSFGHTLGRALTPGVDFFEAEVSDYGRRWNYGVMSRVGRSDEPDGSIREWTVVALGVVPASGESVNGVVGWVTDDELVALDRREQNYDRVDITDMARVHGEHRASGPMVTYVPREAPQRWYQAARDRGDAAIEQRYWDLVDGAFTALGDDRRERYLATTPPPDIPVVAMRADSVPARHRTE